MSNSTPEVPTDEVEIRLNEVSLAGHVGVPAGARTLTVFVHGSGSSRHSRRNNFVADHLNDNGVATLLFDLLTAEEDRTYATRFDIDLLTSRLADVLAWTRSQSRLAFQSVALFGASTGAAAAIRVAAGEGRSHDRARICSVVSRGGRPDLAGDATARLYVPTMLIVGGADTPVPALNEEARARIPGEVELEVIPAATHLFEEPGALNRVAEAAAEWIGSHCPQPVQPAL
ncbi:MAG: dienelactone hydrolase family protein [bacterium]